MKWQDIGALLSLAALWGSSYLFMRMGAGDFGALPLAGMRAAGAAVLLLPLLAWQRGLRELRTHWRGIAVVGLTNSALPFVLFSWAALLIPAGSSALFTGATPLCTAAIGWLWLRDRLGAPRIAGLGIGFAGVVWLVWDKLSLSSTDGGASGWAALACLSATVLYGICGNYTKRYLGAVSPMAIAAGSQLAAALMLALPAAAMWPARMPGAKAWFALGMLALACSAIAYVLFFRLIARIGAPRAMTCAFMIPAFGVLWGSLFLGEAFSVAMGVGCAIILAGTLLATGALEPVFNAEGRSGNRTRAGRWS
jgi:drug/metabolite transporter (DMT)-like permease